MLVVGSTTGVLRMPTSGPRSGQAGCMPVVVIEGPKLVDQSVLPLSAGQHRNVQCCVYMLGPAP